MPLAAEVMEESILAMQLPPLCYPTTYRKVTIWSSPGGITLRNDVPFSPSPSSLLLVLHLEIGLPEDNPDDWDENACPSQERTFIIPVSAFIARLDAIKADQNQFQHHKDEEKAYPRPMTILPWALWGQDARLLPETSAVQGLCGSRVLVSERAGPEENEVIAIYDFSTLASLLEDAAALCKNSNGLSYSIPPPFHQGCDDVLETRVLSAAPLLRIVTDLTIADGEEPLLYEDGVCIFPANPRDP